MRLKVAAIIVASIVSVIPFQNCTPGGAPKNTQTKSNGNGDFYGGKVFVHRQMNSCPDGNFIAAKIEVSNEGGYTLQRENCVDLSSPRTLSANEVVGGGPVLIYSTKAYTDEVIVPEPPAPTSCKIFLGSPCPNAAPYTWFDDINPATSLKDISHSQPATCMDRADWWHQHCGFGNTTGVFSAFQVNGLGSVHAVLSWGDQDMHYGYQMKPLTDLNEVTRADVSGVDPNVSPGTDSSCKVFLGSPCPALNAYAPYTWMNDIDPATGALHVSQKQPATCMERARTWHAMCGFGNTTGVFTAFNVNGNTYHSVLSYGDRDVRYGWGWRVLINR